VEDEEEVVERGRAGQVDACFEFADLGLKANLLSTAFLIFLNHCLQVWCETIHGGRC
jgi:hypothetical protein